MSDWTIVLWNDARQVAEQAGLRPALWPDAGVAPQAFFEQLRDDDRTDLAALVMASCLPRLEAIAWIAAALPSPPENDPDFASRRLILDAARRWVDEPDESNRRAVHALAENADPHWPETLLGLAIFFSGGSIAPEEFDAVPADPRVSAHLAAGALQAAAMEKLPDDEALLARALDMGHALASRGREALSGS